MSLKHAILVLLETEPSSGYDLMRHFKRSLGYFWNAKHQQVYQQLKKLYEDGLITYSLEAQESRPDKKIYAISPAGEAELGNWISAEVKPNKVNDALLVKIYGGHLTSATNLTQELLNHQMIHRKTLDELIQIEQKYLSLSAQQQQKYKLPYLTLRRGILGEKAWLEWSEEALKEIKK